MTKRHPAVGCRRPSVPFSWLEKAERFLPRQVAKSESHKRAGGQRSGRRRARGGRSGRRRGRGDWRRSTTRRRGGRPRGGDRCSSSRRGSPSRGRSASRSRIAGSGRTGRGGATRSLGGLRAVPVLVRRVGPTVQPPGWRMVHRAKAKPTEVEAGRLKQADDDPRPFRRCLGLGRSPAPGAGPPGQRGRA